MIGHMTAFGSKAIIRYARIALVHHKMRVAIMRAATKRATLLMLEKRRQGHNCARFCALVNNPAPQN